MRAALLALLVLAACPPAAPPLQPPDAPVLEPVPAPVRRHLFQLRGVADDTAMVRLFLDDGCAGPVYLQTTGTALESGVTVELVPGDNVFTANAVSSRGLTSGCAAPLHVLYLPPVRPGSPSVSSRPSSPSNQLRFMLVGAADVGARVRLHEENCGAPVLAELSATAFFEVGFPVDVPVNGARTLAVDAVDEEAASSCATISVTNDSEPPFLGVRLASPSPSPQRLAWVRYSGDAYSHELKASADCTGPVLNSCFFCNGATVEFPADASTPFSVRGQDQAGNTRCVPGARPWVHEPSLPEEEAVVLLPGAFIPGLVTEPLVEIAVGRTRVELFLSPDCSGPVAAERQPYELIYNYFGVSLPDPPDGGFLTARSYRRDGGADPCSNALVLGL